MPQLYPDTQKQETVSHNLHTHLPGPPLVPPLVNLPRFFSTFFSAQYLSNKAPYTPAKKTLGASFSPPLSLLLSL